MFHKKHFYRVTAFVATNSYNGADSRPVSFPDEFMSEGGCGLFIQYNNLNAEWPGHEIPATTGVCVPECFCIVYRRQIKRAVRRLDISRAITLTCAGFERMRRSVAEERLTAKDMPPQSRQDIPEGYHLAALLEFIKSWLSVKDA